MTKTLLLESGFSNQNIQKVDESSRVEKNEARGHQMKKMKSKKKNVCGYI